MKNSKKIMIAIIAVGLLAACGKKEEKPVTEPVEQQEIKIDVAIDINRYLLKELENKSNKIDMLMREIDELKEQFQKRPLSSLDEKAVKSSYMRSHLDNPVQKALTQSMHFETQLNEKLRILDDLEHKLIQLAIEIENK